MSLLNFHRKNFHLRFLLIFFLVFINFFAQVKSSENLNSLQAQLVIPDILTTTEGSPVDTVKNCSICLKNFVQEFALKCTHSFCETCIFRWAKIKLTCPLCRFVLTEDQNLLHLVNKWDNIYEEFSKMNIIGACVNGLYDVVDFHIQNGQDLNIFYSGHTLLKITLYHDHYNVFELLIQNGVDINGLNQFGECLLYKESKEGSLEHVKFILAKGADPNILHSSNKRNPLHGACIEGHLEIIKVLLDAGAQIGAKDTWGLTPLTMALTMGHLRLDIFNLLSDWNANLIQNESKILLDI